MHWVEALKFENFFGGCAQAVVVCVLVNKRCVVRQRRDCGNSHEIGEWLWIVAAGEIRQKSEVRNPISGAHAQPR